MLELGPAAGNMDNLAAVASAVPDTGTAAESVAVDTVALDIAAVDTAGSPLEFHTEPVGTEAGTAVVLAPDSGDIEVETAGWCP